MKTLATALTASFAVVLALDGAADDKTIEKVIGGKKVKMVLTGEGVRTTDFFKVYTIKSYMQEGLPIHTAKELAEADAPKQLHLVMLRRVSGPSMVAAISSSLRANYPAPAFEKELKTLTEFVQTIDAERDHHIWLTHIPKVGFHWNFNGASEKLIESTEFSTAIWNNYLGKNNLSETLKAALISRLPKK